MADNARFGFKNMAHHGASGFRKQSGSVMTGGADPQYQSAGVQSAITAFQQGGVNALLAFLASFDGGAQGPTGSGPAAGFEAA